MELTKITEGPAACQVPKSGNEVFYNPRMAFNRMLSSLALGACLPRLKRRRLLDGFCASGIRGIRYALENDLEEVVFLDASPSAIKLAKKNAALNKLKNTSVACSVFNHYASSGNYFDIVEIDPFGTPAPYLAGALRALPKKGLLSVTATDLATLCGSANGPAKRRYDAQPLYTEYAHELALRTIIGFAARQAAVVDIGITPLFSFYRDHYAKTFLFTEKSAKKADASLSSIGFVSHCQKCGHRVACEQKECVCGAKMKKAGPLWIGEVNDADILKTMEATAIGRETTEEFAAEPKEKGKNAANLKKAGENIPESKANAKTAEFIGLLRGEMGFPPYFFDLHKAGRGKATPRTVEVERRLQAEGFRTARTHYEPTAIKTDAPIAAVRRCT